MKKVAGITLMVALLGFNAYLWPTLIKEVKADQKNEVGLVQAAKNSADSTPAMDLANQGPRAANVSAYPVEQPIGQKNPSAVTASKSGTESKKQPAMKAVQTASSKQPKKTVKKPSTPSRQSSDGPDVRITYTYEPSYIHYEETTYSTTSSYGGGSFNMPLEYNPYTGRIQEVYKVYRGMEAPTAPTLNKQSFGIPETVQPYVPPVKKDQQRLAPQSYPGR